MISFWVFFLLFVFCFFLFVFQSAGTLIVNNIESNLIKIKIKLTEIKTGFLEILNSTRNFYDDCFRIECYGFRCQYVLVLLQNLTVDVPTEAVLLLT